MKIAILGTGMIAKEFLEASKELNFEAIYAWGRNKEKLDALNSVNKKFNDLKDILNSDADTIYIALPNHLHYEFAKKALINNKNVIIEKPSTAKVKEIKELISIAKERKLFLFEASIVPYNPMIKNLKSDLTKIGNIKIVNMNFSQYSSRYDNFKKGILAPVFRHDCNGGALMDLQVYNIYFLLSLFGTPKKYNYQAYIEQNIDTSGILTFEYDKFCAICIASKSSNGPRLASIQGDQATIICNQTMNDANNYIINYTNKNKETIDLSNNHHRLYDEFKYFIDAIDNSKYEECEKLYNIIIDVCKILEECRENNHKH